MDRCSLSLLPAGHTHPGGEVLPAGQGDFFDLVLKAHVTAAALEFIRMSLVDNLPTNHVFPPKHIALSAFNRKQYLHDTVGSFVDKFVLRNVESNIFKTRNGNFT